MYKITKIFMGLCLILILNACGGGSSSGGSSAKPSVENDEETKGLKGIVVSSFGTNGYVLDTTKQNSVHSSESKTAIDSSGNIFISGTTHDKDTSDDGFIVKYGINGFIDDTFGNNGILKISNVTNNIDKLDRINGLAIDNENNLYITGKSENNKTKKDTIFILKYDNNGKIVV